MAAGFFMDVLEVVSVYDAKDKNGVLTGKRKAQIQTEFGTFVCLLKDGLDIPEGWSGSVTGIFRIQPAKVTYRDGGSSDVRLFSPSMIQEWYPKANVRLNADSAMSQFMSSLKKR